jgi:maleylpyruvate isomerase
MIPQLDLDGARRAHDRLLERLPGIHDDDIPRPSRLGGWTVGHVLTHIARNADGMTAMFLAASRGQVGDQYPGGVAQRAADIEAGAGRGAADLVADVRTSCGRLDQAWSETSDHAWATGAGRTVRGVLPLPDLVFKRWREVEVHHADLGLGFGWRDWSLAYVDRELDEAANVLAARLPDGMAVRLQPTDAIGCWIIETVPAERVVLEAPRHELLAWLLGRHDRPDWPELAPWLPTPEPPGSVRG